jgi:DNA polymerase-3 subunit beta
MKKTVKRAVKKTVKKAAKRTVKSAVKRVSFTKAEKVENAKKALAYINKKEEERAAAADSKTPIPEPSIPEPIKKAEKKAIAKELNLTFDRKALEPALLIAKDFMGKGGAMPILNSINLKAEHGNCTLTVSDLETSWKAIIKCGGDNINICVPLDLITKEIRALHPEIETVELKFEEDTVKVNGRCEMYTIKGEEFPSFPEPENPFEVTIDEFIQKSKRVLVAAGESDTRYTLNSIYVDLEKGNIVGTDGHRLHIEPIATKKKDGRKLIIPRKPASLIVKHCTDTSFLIGTAHVQFNLGGGTMVTRLLDGNYPDYENVIPKEIPLKVTFSATELLRVLSGAVPVSSGNKGVRLTINGKIEVEATNPGLGSYKWHLPCTSEGVEEGFMVSLNADYLGDAVRTFTTKENDTVVMEMSESLSPCLINSRAVVMPMRI